MWHEARRQERKIRVMMVDYQKRADRRRQFYEQIVCIIAVLIHDAVRHVSFTRICNCRIFRMLPHFSHISEN